MLRKYKFGVFGKQRQKYREDDVSGKFNIPYTTLQRYLKKMNADPNVNFEADISISLSKLGTKSALSKTKEVLVDFLIVMCWLGLPIAII